MAGEVRSFCNSFFAQSANLQSRQGSGPVLQLAVLDAPGPADTAVGGQGALQLDARVGHLHVVVHRLPLLGHQAEGRHGDLWSRTHRAQWHFQFPPEHQTRLPKARTAPREGLVLGRNILNSSPKEIPQNWTRQCPPCCQSASPSSGPWLGGPELPMFGHLSSSPGILFCDVHKNSLERTSTTGTFSGLVQHLLEMIPFYTEIF